MPQVFDIKKVAVLGAGVMGAQIAAHCVNAGFPTLLYDLPAKEGPINGLVEKAIANLKKLKPAPLALAGNADLLQAKNYQTDLAELSGCDLVIEAIAERLDWKEDLYKKIAPFLSENTIVASNTSGLSINTLAGVLPKTMLSQFCGIHFFNPPRYMHLAEIIPSKDTSSALLDYLETWLTSQLGKGVVRAKDTPNFIANRIGVFSMISVLHHTLEMGLSLDEVDALTGPLIGRPKSATYRTMDVVGLDTMVHVINTMKTQLASDPWHSCFKLPGWLEELVKAGALGQKSGQGLYRKAGKQIEVFDWQSGQYRPMQARVSEAVLEILKIANPKERMAKLFSAEDRQAKFLAACFRDLFHYCAYHLAEIANNTRDVDLAIRWGFGWMQGPFETWQLADIAQVTQEINSAIETKQAMAAVALPSWLNQLKAFYTEEGAYSPAKKTYESRSSLAVYRRQYFPDAVLAESKPACKTIYENEGVKLWHLQDEIAILSFKSKANTVGQAVLDGMEEAISLAERDFKGLVVYQTDAGNFSSGADLRDVAGLIQAGKMDALDAMIAQFQRVAMRLKYSSVPTVAALRGRALGGGCELMMHCAAVVAAFESYPGLVEAGVGVIPAGGGCKELALRAARNSGEADLMETLQSYFKQVATATVAGSAVEAQQMGFLKASDLWVMHKDEVLFAALARVRFMNDSNYHPPIPAQFKVAGIEGKARIQVGLVNWLEGGFISAHDYFLATELATVMTGGNLNQGTVVDEQWILDLERKAFLTLAASKPTQERIAHLLETGKPLRN